MATKLEIIYDIKERLNSYSDDSNLTDRYLSHLVDEYRSVFLKNKYSTFKRKIPIINKQRVELTMSPERTSRYAGAIMSSAERVPDTLDSTTFDNRMVLSVGQLEVRNLNMVSPERFPHIALEDPFTRTMIYGSILDDQKLYLKSYDSNIQLMTSVKLWGVFSDPYDAWLISPEFDANLDFEEDVEYPLEYEIMADMIRTMVKDLTIKFELPVDKQNNSDDSTEPNRK